MLTFICYPKCTTCQKAKTLLDSCNAQYATRDIKTDNPSYEELKTWLALSELPVKKFFNTNGQLYRSLGLKDKLPTMNEDECLRLLASDGMLVKRPLLVDEYRALVGFNAVEWYSVFEYDRKITDKIFDDYMNEMLDNIRLKEIADKSPYKLRVVDTQSGKVAVQNFEIPMFDDSEIVLGYAAHVKRIHNCCDIAIYKEMFEDNFFDLSSGIANELTGRLVKDNFRLAIIGDFSSCGGKHFHDFICESNKGKHLFFVANEDEALTKLGDLLR